MSDPTTNRFYREVEQGSPEWFAERLGKATASRIADIIATTKSSGWAASREAYRTELVVERLTGKPYPQFTNASMQWGTDTEPQAVDAYFQRDILADIATVGFVPHPTIAMSGASPDRLVGEDGLLEVKCPNSNTHWKTLRDGKIKKEYEDQVQWQLACTQRKWCDWVSFDPRMPENLRLFAKRIPRDGTRIAILETEVRRFLDEVDADVKWAMSQ